LIRQKKLFLQSPHGVPLDSDEGIGPGFPICMGASDVCRSATDSTRLHPAPESTSPQLKRMAVRFAHLFPVL